MVKSVVEVKIEHLEEEIEYLKCANECLRNELDSLSNYVYALERRMYE